MLLLRASYETHDVWFMVVAVIGSTLFPFCLGSHGHSICIYIVFSTNGPLALIFLRIQISNTNAI